jgi:hypothetical protein
MRESLFILGAILLLLTDALLKDNLDLVKALKVSALQSIGVISIFVAVFWGRST